MEASLKVCSFCKTKIEENSEFCQNSFCLGSFAPEPDPLVKKLQDSRNRVYLAISELRDALDELTFIQRNLITIKKFAESMEDSNVGNSR